jgi:hypothetical protein
MTPTQPYRWLSILVFALVAAIGSPARGHDVATAPAAASDVLSGTVESLIIEDRVQDKTLSFSLLRQDDGTTVPLVGAASRSLAPGMRVGILGRWNGPEFEVDRAEPTGGLASRTAPATVAVEGALAVIHADNFETGRSQFIYQVRDDGGTVTTLEIAALPSALRGGMRVLASGHSGAGPASLRPQQITILSYPAARGARSPLEKAATINNVLVIMGNFNNTPQPAFTQAQAQAVMVSNANSVANYYSEVSYGQQLLSVTVTPWLTMAMASPPTCDWSTIGTNEENAATAAGYNLANYSIIVHLFPSLGSCGWSGLAYVGFGRSWINGIGSFQTLVIAHETGHNFGLLHAGSLNCGANSIGGSCSVAEYGDPWDTMGNQRAMHFNAYQKSIINFIASSAFKIHNSGSVNYTLDVLEQGGGALYGVMIPTSNVNRTYLLEYRQPIGFDAALSSYPNNGAQVRLAGPQFEWSSGSDDTEIVDMKPTTPGNFTDSALVVGQNYTDATVGVSITVTAATASQLMVNVTTANGAATTTSLSSSANPSTAGSNVTFTASVTGVAPTGSVAFTDGGVTIAGCASSVLSGSGNTRTATCSTAALSATTHSIVASYGGDASNAASSSTTLSQVVNKATSTTTLATSQTPAALNANVTFTATVSGFAPTGTVNFKDGANSISGCSAAAFSGGSGNVRTAQCVTSTLAAGNHNITAVYSGDGSNNGSTSGVLVQAINNAPAASVNVALASNGGVASASSAAGGYPASAIIDGDRAGLNFGMGGVWRDGTRSVWPDWVEIDFSGAQTIDHVIVYSAQDNTAAPVDPSNTMTFTLRGATAFDVQAWVGSAWVTLGSVSGNNLVKRTVAFAATTTSKIRVVINASANANYSFLTEVEAWSVGGAAPPPPPPPPPGGSTTVTSSLNPAKPNASLTFTATVTGNNPTGTVGFTSNGAPITGCTASPLSGNPKTAQCVTSFPVNGTYNIVASYSGDASNAASVSAALAQVIKSMH